MISIPISDVPKAEQLQLGEMKKSYDSHVRLYLRPNGPKSSPKCRNARLQDRVQKCCCYPNCSANSTRNSNYVCRYTLPLQCSSHQRTKAAKENRITSPRAAKQKIREQCTSWILKGNFSNMGKTIMQQSLKDDGSAYILCLMLELVCAMH